MKIGLIDPNAGVAGDMFVGALLDAGASFKAVRDGLGALAVEGFTVSHRKVQRGGIAARKFRVRHKEAPQETHFDKGCEVVLGKLQQRVRGELSTGGHASSGRVE